MAFVDSANYVRQGLAVNGEVLALDDAVNRAGKASGNDFPPGPWWQRWKGFAASWSQFFSQNVQKPPVLPVQDNDDLNKWASDVAEWRLDFAKLEAERAAGIKPPSAELQGPLTSTIEVAPTLSASSLGNSVATGLKVASVIAGVGAVGYLLSGAARLRGR